MTNLKLAMGAGALCLAMLTVPAGAVQSAVRTRILLAAPDSGAAQEVSANRTFFDGERFRLAVNSNQSGYLYVLCLTSQGDARLLYPNQGSGNNRVGANTRRTLPERGWFRFDQEPGTEHVFVMISRRPVPELDDAAESGGALDMSALDRFTESPAKASTGGYDEFGARGIDIEPDPAYNLNVLNLRHESR